MQYFLKLENFVHDSTTGLQILVNKTNRSTEFQFYWYYDSTCFGQPFIHSFIHSLCVLLIHTRSIDLWDIEICHNTKVL